MNSPALIALAVAIWIAWVTARHREASLAARAVLLIGGLVLLSPNVFPWYTLWLVPFLAAAPSIPWVAFTGTVTCAYAFFLVEPWAVPWWARAIEFLPLVVGALWWALGRGPAPRWQERST